MEMAGTSPAMTIGVDRYFNLATAPLMRRARLCPVS
jgi:hypothetical protein